MILKDKVAVIYGAAGAIGGAAARALAHEGAKLYLTGRLQAPVEAVAQEIVSTGGFAEAVEVDALDEQAVDKHLQSVIDKANRVDISFNAVGIPDAKILGVPLVELDVEQFWLPISSYTTSYFLTARLAARHMIPKKSGGDHDRHRTPLADGHPFGGRLRSGDGRQGGTHSRSLRRACTSGHSRRWSATAGHAGDPYDQRRLRASRQGLGPDLGTVARVPGRQDPPATAHDA
jgi:NAD(P)-dependent dehydrogenase (short-subunit alcohol dehydrogenase family)